MRLIDIAPAEQAARIRAAIGYSGQENQAIAKSLGISYATLRRRYDRTDPSGVGSMEELYAIADICGVPRGFMEEGFSRYAPDATLGERVGVLEAQLRERSDRVDRRFERLEEDLEARLATLVTQALEQAEQPAPSTRRRRGA